MSNVHVAAYYANRFDPDTLFPELAIVPSKDVFYGIPLSALSVASFEYEATFNGISITALGISDFESNWADNFLPDGNPSVTSSVDSTIAIGSWMSTLGLTYLTSPYNQFDMTNQFIALSVPEITYSNDFIMSSVVKPFDYMITVAFETVAIIDNTSAHAGYKFGLLDAEDVIVTDFSSTAEPSQIYIKESNFNLTVAI